MPLAPIPVDEPNVLFLDELTNDLDADTLTEPGTPVLAEDLPS